MQALLANPAAAVQHGIGRADRDEIVHRPNDGKAAVVLLDGVDDGERQLFVDKVEDDEIGLFCLKERLHLGVRLFGIGDVQHHVELALDAALYRGVGDKVFLLRAGKIFLILHGEEDDLVTQLLKGFGKGEVIALRTSLHIMKFID